MQKSEPSAFLDKCPVTLALEIFNEWGQAQQLNMKYCQVENEPR